MSNEIDHTEINRALAKAIAYKKCGKHEKAAAWATKLVGMLQVTEILSASTMAAYTAGRIDHIAED